MLTSNSTKGCRLRPTDRPTIGAVKTTGLTSGYVDLSKVPGRTRKTVKRVDPPARKPRHRKPVLYGNSIA
jgi:hypothetical protein